MRSWRELIGDWRRHLEEDTSLADTTVESYIGDVERWAAWADRAGILGPDQVTTSDVKEYRDAREEGAGKAAATANRRVTSLGLLLEHCGRAGSDNPARRVKLIREEEDLEGRALERNEWNAVRRHAERTGQLAEALVAVMRYAGTRVGELAPRDTKKKPPLLLGDLLLQPRKGELQIRKAKGTKQRKVPLVAEAREPLERYIRGDRADRLDAWAREHRWNEQHREWWDSDQAPVFLSERGPITVRGIRHIVANLGQEARLPYILGPHDLRATCITAWVDPDKYGLATTPMPLTVAQKLAGHAKIETTARYARPGQADLERWMNQAAGD